MTLDELDRLAAEKVMIWSCGPYYGDELPITGWFSPQGQMMSHYYAWQPTRNIAQAWECSEKIEHDRLIFIRPPAKAGTWKVKFAFGPYGARYLEAEGAFATEAIVRACLKAKGVEIE